MPQRCRRQIAQLSSWPKALGDEHGNRHSDFDDNMRSCNGDVLTCTMPINGSNATDAVAKLEATTNCVCLVTGHGNQNANCHDVANSNKSHAGRLLADEGWAHVISGQGRCMHGANRTCSCCNTQSLHCFGAGVAV